MEGAIFLADFSIQKIDVFGDDFYEFPELGTIFARSKHCRTSVRIVEPFPSQTQRNFKIWHAVFALDRFGPFLNLQFLGGRLPSQTAPPPIQYAVGGEPKNVKENDV